MEGFIDHVSTDRLSVTGWIRNPDNQEPKLQIRHLGQNFGSCTFGPASGNVLALKGDTARSFRIDAGREISPLSILSGQFEVNAIPAERGRPIFPSSGLIRREQAVLARFFESLDDAGKTRIGSVFGLSTPSEFAKPNPDQDLSHISFPVGLESQDGNVRLGKNGYFFATGGSNQIEKRYTEAQTQQVAIARQKEVDGWKALIRRREEYCASRGIRFHQLIVPDKITVLRKFAPFEVNGATHVLRLLTTELRHDTSYINLLPLFEGWDSQMSPWRKADTHPTPATMMELTSMILTSLGCNSQFLSETEFMGRSYHEGDLGRRFFNVPVWDENIEPSSLAGVDISKIEQRQLRDQFSTKTTVNRRNGVYMKYVNPNPIINKKLIIFGTSTSNYGIHPNQLSWWLKQIFTEYHFIWQTDIEYDIIDQVKPDVVIAQSVERYLARIPRQ